MVQQSSNRLWIYALIVFVAAILIYRVTVTSTFSGDDLQYSTVIQTSLTGDLFYHPTGGRPYTPNLDKGPIVPPKVNPRYLFEWPTSLLAGQIWQAGGWQDNVIAPIQTLRIVVGALGLVAFFLAVQTLVNHIPISLLVTTGLGLTVSYWTYSIHQDQSMNMVTILCVAFYVFARQSKTGFTRRGIIVLIIILALSALYNFTAAVSGVAFGIGVALFSKDTSFVGRFRTLVTFGLAYGLFVVVILVGIISITVSPSAIVDPAFWREATFGGRPEYLISPVQDAIRAALGLGKSQILIPGVYGSLNAYFETAPTANRIVLLAYYAVVLLLMAAPFVFLAVRRKKLGTNAKVAVFLTVWLLAHALFNWFWDPGFNKYWLLPLVCCWAIFALALEHVKDVLTRYFRPAFIAVGVFIAVSFVINLTTQFLPDSRADQNEWLTIANQMKTESQPADVFLSPGHPMDFYLIFFGRRDTLSASLINYDSNENAAILDTAFSTRIADHLADNGKIYVYGLETLNEDQRAAFEALLGSGDLTEKWNYPGTIIYEWTPSA